MITMLLSQVDSADTALESTITGLSNTEAEAAAATAAGGLLVGGMLIFAVIGGIIALALLIWWITQIIDLAGRDFPEKGTWMLLMILSLILGLNLIMSIVYHFSVVKKGLGKKAAPATA